VVRQAKGLEGTEPEMASMIYQAIATAQALIHQTDQKEQSRNHNAFK